MLVTRYDGGLVTGMYYFRNIFTKGAGLNSSALCIIFRGKRHFFSKAVKFTCFGKKEQDQNQEMHASEDCYAGRCQDVRQSFMFL